MGGDQLIPSSEQDDALVRVEGVVERVVYENEENGFMVARLRESNAVALTTFVGNLMALSVGETVRLWGGWVEDKRFGRQLRVEKYETVLPTSADAIEKYLASGLVKGIGPKLAKRLVKAFGVETLRVIGDEPKRLRSVEGIGPKRVEQIQEAWEGQRAVRSIMLFLQGHGIGLAHAIKIYKRYGDGAVTVLRENPYRLADDILGIAFRTADDIAAKLGIAKDAPQRLEAGLLYTLQRATSEGHVFLPSEELVPRAAELLEVHPDKLDTPLAALARRKGVTVDDDAVYLPWLHVAETGCDEWVKRLLGVPCPKVPIKVDKALEWVEKTVGIDLSDEQAQAIRTAIASKVMVITGGPGTGKTTVLNSLLEIFSRKDVSISLAAPTGRAAKRMEVATGHEACTLHRLLEFSPKEGGFTRHEGNPLTADLVVVDECSMIDVNLMHSLLRALPPQARLLIVGDVDQLPSVGPGNVLLDVIASGLVPVVWLKTVFRQAEESGIIANAHRINQGQEPAFNPKDFFFVERKNPPEALATVVELVADRIPKKFNLDPKRDIQVLAPMHRGDVGVARLNEELQGALNPGVEPVGRRPFGIGDKVMQMRNNYELDVFNGDVGVVTAVDTELKEVQVAFDDQRVVLYEFDDLDELALAYASTVHKSQGSEYPVVVLPLMPQHFMLLQRNVLYTAVTRAKQMVVVVGDPKAVRIAVRNTKVTRRFSRLADRLRNAI
ncbi:MAG: ATP-dependent RecD-like DNA helicase [bacterium]|nr:ATP-dependent RecD-like DNA helicase [bacterium]